MRRSTPLEELLFLGMFVALFALTLTLLNKLLLPHHYAKIVILILTSLIVSLATIFLRHWLFFRKRDAR